MIIGSFPGTLSEARRIAVPKKFLNELGDRPIIAKWYESCLILVNNGFWEELSLRLTGGNQKFNLLVRDIERFILGSAYEVEPDEQGRIVIPEELAKYAGISKEIIFLGLLDRVEIWPKENWEEKNKSLPRLTRDYIENLAKNEKR